uniref:Uncharacterized protein n=1 Tax=Ditylenchus dipsaci TaxID=166011 RepID=A0A915E325_9BILA
MDNIRKLILDKQNILKGGSSLQGMLSFLQLLRANPPRVSTDSSTLCTCSRWGSSNLFVTQLLASLLSWVLVVTVAFVVCITWKKFKMRGLFEILKTEEIHNSKDCEQAVYMKQISDCENN